jgi:hypothetical protein
VLFEVLEVKLNINADAGDAGQSVCSTSLHLKQTTEDLFDWDSGFVPEASFSPATDLPSALRPPAPTGLTTTTGESELYEKKDGTIVSRIRFSWTPVPDSFVQNGGRYEI